MHFLKRELRDGAMAVAIVCGWPLVAAVCGDSIHDLRLAVSLKKIGKAVDRLERIRQSVDI